MKNTLKKNDNGFTLIEVLISIAIIAVLMTAVCSLMASNTRSYRRTKANITVQNSAQETYNEIRDSIIQAKTIKVYGYSLASGTSVEFDHNDVGAASSITLTDVIVANDNSGTKKFTDMSTYDASAGLREYTDVLVTKLEVEYACPIELAYVPASKKNVAGTEVKEIKDGGTVYHAVDEETDICKVTYVFSGKNIYVSRDYKYMTALNDPFVMDGANYTDTNLYNSMLNYVTVGTTEVSGIIMYFGADDAAVGLNMYFADQHMNYDLENLITVKNSYVMTEYQSRTSGN